MYWGTPQLTSPPSPCSNFLQKVLFAGGSDSPYAKAMKGQITLSQVSPWVPIMEHCGCSDAPGEHRLRDGLCFMFLGVY